MDQYKFNLYQFMKFIWIDYPDLSSPAPEFPGRCDDLKKCIITKWLPKQQFRSSLINHLYVGIRKKGHNAGRTNIKLTSLTTYIISIHLGDMGGLSGP